MRCISAESQQQVTLQEIVPSLLILLVTPVASLHDDGQLGENDGPMDSRGCFPEARGCDPIGDKCLDPVLLASTGLLL